MAQILSFRTPEFRSAEVTSRRDGESAEVIVFPGVRYEHWENRDAASGNDTRRRDVIELADQ